MTCVESIDRQRASAKPGEAIRLPLGLLGFEQIKDYVLVAEPAEAPFQWLQVLHDPTIAFLVMSPFAVLPDYRPQVAAEDLAFLGLRRAEEARLLNVVTLHGPRRATLNLKGPVVLNGRTLAGKQVIPLNAAEYSVQHPLPLADG